MASRAFVPQRVNQPASAAPARRSDCSSGYHAESYRKQNAVRGEHTNLVTIPVRRGSNGDDADGPLFQWPIQAKLAIGARNDPLERQADESADRVLRAAQGNRPEQNTIQRKCAACEDEERKQLSRKESGFSAAWGATVAPPVVREALNS